MNRARSRSLLVLINILLCCLASNIVCGNDEEQYKVVNTQHGDVRGKLLKTLFDDGEYFSFKGIPYAKPPLNELRFKVSLMDALSNFLELMLYIVAATTTK